MNLSVKNVKTFQGREGIGYNCDLYLDGEKVAQVLNDAGGGSFYYHAINGNYERWRELEVRLHAYALSLPPIVDEQCPGGLQPSLDMVVEELVNGFLVERDYKRKCKTKTLFRTAMQKPGEYFELKSPYTPDVKAYVEGKYPGAEIINERFL